MCIFASGFLQVIMKKNLIASGNQVVRFPKCSMIIFFDVLLRLLYFCNLNATITACYYIFSLVALLVPEKCFCSTESTNENQLSRDAKRSSTCVQMFFELKWRNLETASPLLPCIGECSCLVDWIDFCSFVGQDVCWIFRVMQSYGKRLLLDSKKDLTLERSNLQFFRWNIGTFVNSMPAWSRILKNRSSSFVFLRVSFMGIRV